MEQEKKNRCAWVSVDPVYIQYHDQEWGVPVHDDKKLFEFLVLESAQAGLSWITILKRRENYRRAFDNFDPERVARYDEKDVQRLLRDKGIIRNEKKVRAAVKNAQAFVAIQHEFGSFDKYIWRFTDAKPLMNAWEQAQDVPVKTEISIAISRDLKQRGFQFIGPVICYAHMQATGMVNDHTMDCFRHHEIKSAYS